MHVATREYKWNSFHPMTGSAGKVQLVAHRTNQMLSAEAGRSNASLYYANMLMNLSGHDVRLSLAAQHVILRANVDQTPSVPYGPAQPEAKMSRPHGARSSGDQCALRPTSANMQRVCSPLSRQLVSARAPRKPLKLSGRAGHVRHTGCTRSPSRRTCRSQPPTKTVSLSLGHHQRQPRRLPHFRAH